MILLKNLTVLLSHVRGPQGCWPSGSNSEKNCSSLIWCRCYTRESAIVHGTLQFPYICCLHSVLQCNVSENTNAVMGFEKCSKNLRISEEEEEVRFCDVENMKMNELDCHLSKYVKHNYNDVRVLYLPVLLMVDCRVYCFIHLYMCMLQCI